MKKTFVSALILGVMVAPVFAGAQTTDDSALIATLEQQIQELQQQIATLVQQRLSAQGQANQQQVSGDTNGFSTGYSNTSSGYSSNGTGPSTVSPRSISITKSIMNGVPCGPNSLSQTTSFKPGDNFCIRFHIENHDTSIPHGTLDLGTIYDIVSIDTPNASVFYYSMPNNQFNSHYGQTDDVYVQGTIAAGAAPGQYALTNHVASRQCTPHTTLATDCGGWTDATLSIPIAILGTNTTTTTGPSVTLSASPSVVTSGQLETLTWSSIGATSCGAGSVAALLQAQGKVGFGATSGSVSFIAQTNSGTSWDIQCVDANGKTGYASTNITINQPAIPTAGTITISATPSTVAYNSPTTLTWSSTGNVSSCAITRRNSTDNYLVGGSGVLTTSALQGPVETFTISCNNGTVVNSVAVNVTPKLLLPGILPTTTLSANPTSVTTGQPANLYATETGATSCTLNGQPTALGFMSPMQVVPTTTTTYTYICTNTAGSSAPLTTTITVNGSSIGSPTTRSTPSAPLPPSTGLTVSPSTITAGQSAYLTLNNPSGANCVINPTIGVANPSNYPVSPSTTTTYTATCSNSAGTNVASVTVTVNPAPTTNTTTSTSTAPPAQLTVTMGASPASISPGQSVTLTWNSQNATSCRKSGAWGSDSLPLSGTATVTPVAGVNYVSPTNIAMYYVACSNATNSVSASAAINISQSSSNALDAIAQLLEEIRAQINSGNVH